MKNENIKSEILCGIGIIALILTILFNFGIRQRVIELDAWKTTYENGYCPTCGQPLNH